MGTNFYAIIPMKERNKKTLEKMIDQLKSELDNDNYSKLKCQVYEIEEQLKDFINGKKVHLGKRSVGWSFCWDANELKYYKPSLKSIHKWVTDNNAIIEDEYGDKFTWEEFINDEIGYCLYTSKPIKTIDDLHHPYNKSMFNIIKKDYLDKGIPFYEFCSHRTYYEMHPDEGSYNYSIEHPDFTKYAKDGFVDEEFTEFHSKDGLRFVTYTDFS